MTYCYSDIFSIFAIRTYKINNMPQICTFYGLIILMNFADHTPAHFHVWYNDYKVIVNIKDGVVKGE